MAVLESGNPLLHSGKHGPWFRGLCLASVVSVFALVVLGGVVRVTDSGLGCPDWPLCYGKAIPPLQADAIIEFSHRLVASALVGPLVAASCCFAWVAYRRDRWLVGGTTLALALTLAQAGLGGITVLTELHGSLVAAHLAMAQALLACLVAVAVAAHKGGMPPLRRSVAGGRLPLVAGAGLGVYALIMTGSLVTVSGATAACVQWPTCNGGLLPETMAQWIHMAHRVAAVLIGALLLYALHAMFRRGENPPEIRWLSLLAAGVFAAQTIAGAFTVWLGFGAEMRALHLSLATLLWGAMAALIALELAGGKAPGKESAHA